MELKLNLTMSNLAGGFVTQRLLGARVWQTLKRVADFKI